MNTMKSQRSYLALLGLTCFLVVAVAADLELENQYKQLFARGEGSPMKPRETLEGLKKLESLLAKEESDPLSQNMRAEVNKLIHFSPIVSCNAEIAVDLGESLDKYGERDMPSILAYLKRRRDALFEICNYSFKEKAQKALAELEAQENSEPIKHFREFVAKNTPDLPRLTFANGIKSKLLSFMAKEYSGRVDSKMNAKEFDEVFEATLKPVCKAVLEQTKFMEGFTFLFASKTVSRQMARPVRELYRMHTVCGEIDQRPEISASYLHRKLTSESGTPCLGLCTGGMD